MPQISFGEVMAQMDWERLLWMVVSVIPALLCITIHEVSHGLAALALGDRTAETQKRLSLNPLRHVDVMGLLMLVVFKIGWARPVPVNMMNFRNPRLGMALTALAGPVSNFLLAIIILFLRGLLTPAALSLSWGQTALSIADATAYMSVGLGVFNLIPIPPMDGSKLLFAILPERAYFAILRYEKYGMILIVLLVFSNVFDSPLAAAFDYVFERFFVVAQAGAKLAMML